MNRSGESRLVSLVLLVLIVASAVVRWLYIQRISLFFDEFTTLWAARTVLERGLPLFPSGNFYTHGLLFTYLEAPFLWAFGLQETLLRLPSLFIGVGTVVATFFVGRQLFSTCCPRQGRAGLIAAAAVAMDPEAIAWGGRVRMYALLQLLVLLAVYTFYRGAIADDRPGWRWLSLGLLVGAMFAHAEAALLLPALALAVLVARGLRWSLRPSVVGPFLLGVGGFAAVIFGVDLAAMFGIHLGEASHLEAIHEVRPYLTAPTSDLLSGLSNFSPAFLDLWRLPFTLVAVAGLIRVLRQPERRSPLIYLYLVLAVALGELFFLAGPTWQMPRYVFMLLPLLWLIVSALLAELLRQRPVWWSAVAAVALAIFLGVVGYRTAFTQEWGYDQAFRYLQEEWQHPGGTTGGDVVLTTNPPASALYLDQADYYAMQIGYEEYVMPDPNGGLVDRWVGAPVLDTVAQLREVLATAPRVWLVVDGWRFQSRFENEFVRTVLDQMEPAFDERGMAVFVGQGYAERPTPAVSKPLHTKFGQELALEGYELSAAKLQPGDELEVSLVWRTLDTPRTAYTVVLHLIGPDGAPDGDLVAQRDELLLGGYYQPTVWPEDEAVVDRHTLTLPADLAPGRYRLEMGLYPAGYEEPLDDSENASLSTEDWDRIVLDYLTTTDTPSPSPEVPLDVDLDGQVRLLGYTLACDSQALTCNVQLHWQATAELGVDYTVFVHLVGEDGHVAGQHDGMPEGGFFPTSAWEPGEIVIDEHRIDMAADTPPGDYQLLTGLYRLETGTRLPVLGPGGQPIGDSIVLTTITVAAGE